MQIITIAAFHSPKVHDIKQLQSSKYMCAQTIINFCGFFYYEYLILNDHIDLKILNVLTITFSIVQ